VQLYSWTQIPSLQVTTLDDKIIVPVVVMEDKEEEPQRTRFTITNAATRPTKGTTTTSSNTTTSTTAAAAAATETTTNHHQQQRQAQAAATTTSPFAVTTKKKKSSISISNTTTTNNNNNNNKKYDATIIIQLRGEMGNNLQKIAYGYGVAWWLDDMFAANQQKQQQQQQQQQQHQEPQAQPKQHPEAVEQLTPHHANLVLRHLKKSKWLGARQDIYQCFPNLRQHDFEQGNTHVKLITDRRHQQDEWFAGINFPHQFPQLLKATQQRGREQQQQQQQLVQQGGTEYSPLLAAQELRELQEAAYNNTWTDYLQHAELVSEWQWAMQAFYRLASARYHPPPPTLPPVSPSLRLLKGGESGGTSSSSSSSNSSNSASSVVEIAIPSIVIGSPMKNVVLDRYYDRYRLLFEFDHDHCCAQRAAPDESVFVSEVMRVTSLNQKLTGWRVWGCGWSGIFAPPPFLSPYLFVPFDKPTDTPLSLSCSLFCLLGSCGLCLVFWFVFFFWDLSIAFSTICQ
jgi:hypothetical protein